MYQLRRHALMGTFSFMVCPCGRHARFEGSGKILVIVASKAMAMAFVAAARQKNAIGAWTATLVRVLIMQSTLPDVEEAHKVDHELGLTTFVDPDVRRMVQAANTIILRRRGGRVPFDYCVARMEGVPQHPN